MNENDIKKLLIKAMEEEQNILGKVKYETQKETILLSRASI